MSVAFLGLAGVAAAANSTSAAASSTSAAAKNIVFIVADDLGFNDVSFHGSTQIPTPAIDELAATGLTLDNYHAQPVCSPTRASVLTGRNHFRDCVDYVYGCSDMTECVPAFPFAQQRTFTFADAVRASATGKWVSAQSPTPRSSGAARSFAASRPACA